jgi:hypothetical protein
VVAGRVGVEALLPSLAGAEMEEVSDAGFAYSQRRHVGRVDRIVGKKVVTMTGAVAVRRGIFGRDQIGMEPGVPSRRRRN